MVNDISKHMKPLRFTSLPEAMRRHLKDARLERGWSQLELGQRIGLPQMHVSGIETGKIVPRFNTLLDFTRTLGYDLMLVPQSLVPAVQGLIRDLGRETEVRPLGCQPWRCRDDRRSTAHVEPRGKYAGRTAGDGDTGRINPLFSRHRGRRRFN